MTSIQDISFFTCCYEADWKYLLIEGRLKEMIEKCNHRFVSKNLIINNVLNRDELLKYANEAIAQGIIDKYFFSEDFIDRMLNSFDIRRRSFRLDGFDGYWYSIGPLAAIYCCTTSFLLYFASDCILTRQASFDWVNRGLEILLKNPKTFCVTPIWDYNDIDLSKIAITEDEFAYYDQGFSDQVFLVRTDNLKNHMYNEYNLKSEIFPTYGGNHFERRVFSFMNNHSVKRVILKNVYYRHDKLLSPGYIIKLNKNRFSNSIRYAVAKIKKRLRRYQVLTKYFFN